jgi:hypothetical protein
VFKVGKATFTHGQLVTVVLSILISALVVYYAIVLSVSRLLRLLERNKAAASTIPAMRAAVGQRRSCDRPSTHGGVARCPSPPPGRAAGPP